MLATGGLICSVVAAAGQEAQIPLGDVVRRQQAEHGKKAKRVVGDEDLGGFHLHEVQDTAATTVIIPDIRITAKVPDGISMTPAPDSKQKMHVWFGPGTLDKCVDIGCAEEEYLRLLPRGVGSAKVLFESDESIDGYPGRVVHMEFSHDVAGKIFAIVAFIQTPVAVAAATCRYKAKDAPEVESDCEAFVRSIRIHMPERYIYVEHHH
jgi:hypothetical protein